MVMVLDGLPEPAGDAQCALENAVVHAMVVRMWMARAHQRG